MQHPKLRKGILIVIMSFVAVVVMVALVMCAITTIV